MRADAVEAIQNTEDYIAAAQEQLDVAIELFLAHRSYIAAVALATSAESLLERALGGKETALQWEFSLVEPYLPYFNIIDPDTPVRTRFEAFRRFKRRERDFANHGPDNRKAHLGTGRPSLHDAAHEAIDRAILNAERLNLPSTEAMSDYAQWFQENVVGPP